MSEPQSSPSRMQDPSRERRAAIISAIKTPLGFFALVVLAVEGILAIAVAVTDGIDRRLLVIGMMSLVFALVLVVAALAAWRPTALYGKSPPFVTVRATRREGEVESGESAPIGGSGIKIIQRRPQFLVAAPVGEPWESVVQGDMDVIQRAFTRARIRLHLNATAKSLGQELLSNTYDFLQLAANVDSCGTIQLSDSSLTAKGLTELMRHSKVNTVVLAACSSATLAAEVAPYSNMVAATGNLSVEGWTEWSSIFYSLLANGVPLSRAYSIAQAVVDIPVIMILRSDTIFAK